MRILLLSMPIEMAKGKESQPKKEKLENDLQFISGFYRPLTFRIIAMLPMQVINCKYFFSVAVVIVILPSI